MGLLLYAPTLPHQHRDETRCSFCAISPGVRKRKAITGRADGSTLSGGRPPLPYHESSEAQRCLGLTPVVAKSGRIELASQITLVEIRVNQGPPRACRSRAPPHATLTA